MTVRKSAINDVYQENDERSNYCRKHLISESWRTRTYTNHSWYDLLKKVYHYFISHSLAVNSPLHFLIYYNKRVSKNYIEYWDYLRLVFLTSLNLKGHQQHFPRACNPVCRVAWVAKCFYCPLDDFESRNILFVSIHFMMTKRLQYCFGCSFTWSRKNKPR